MSPADRLAKDGFLVVEGVVPPGDCDALSDRLDGAAGRPAGAGSRRWLAEPWCAALARRLRQHATLSGLIPGHYVAVQCSSFEKSKSQNWLVPIHQDLVVPVAGRVDETSLQGWSVKEGSVFVHAPASLLAQLLAVRLHIDACAPEDGPLHVVPGSHRLGAVTPEAAAAVRQAGPEVCCALGPGGVLVMRPLLLHRSSKATGTSRRRVLHFVFGPPALPFGLRWQMAA